MNIEKFYRPENDHFETHFLLGSRENGMRLDVFLCEHMTGKSRQDIQKFIASGDIHVHRKNNQQVGRLKPSSLLKKTDEVRIITRRRKEPDVNLDFTCLYEDESLFVVNKPPNLPVHPAGKYFFNTLTTHLQVHAAQNKSNKEFHLPHRIDKDTSGVLVLCKSGQDAHSLIQQFSQRVPKKKYIAIVCGHPSVDQFTVDDALGFDPHSEIRHKVAPVPIHEGGQEAKTQFQVLNRFYRYEQPYSLLECFPLTGRQHQIRVHLAYAGHPIVGDKTYGLAEDQSRLIFFPPQKWAKSYPQPLEFHELAPELQEKLRLPRHALHANWISVIHPRLQKRVEFEAPLPKDMQDFLPAELQEERASSKRSTISTNPAPLA